MVDPDPGSGLKLARVASVSAQNFPEETGKAMVGEVSSYCEGKNPRRLLKLPVTEEASESICGTERDVGPGPKGRAGEGGEGRSVSRSLREGKLGKL